jgi:3-methyladenine DNA glycosylase AlkD
MTAKARLKAILAELRAQANPKNVEGMARYGINPHNALGVSVPFLRGIARREGRDHEVAEQLWASGIHEARILAALMDKPDEITEEQMERWARDFDSWGVCDQCCGNLFDRTPFAWRKAAEWSERREEFVKRAGFVLMAALAVHDKRAADEAFLKFLPVVQRESSDGRNFVRKAVNWALRQIGKRNAALNAEAIRVARSIQAMDSRSARWIATDALRELTSEAVQARLRR